MVIRSCVGALVIYLRTFNHPASQDHRGVQLSDDEAGDVVRVFKRQMEMDVSMHPAYLVRSSVYIRKWFRPSLPL